MAENNFTFDINNVVHASGSGNEQLVRKRRGRPQKSDAAKNLQVSPGSAVTSMPMPLRAIAPQAQMCAVVPQPQMLAVASVLVPQGCALACPPGFENWQIILASLGDFIPHLMDVLPGEDIIRKIMSLAQNLGTGIFILSAIGDVSDTAIRLTGSPGGVTTYEGRFQILSLNGSMTVLSENGSVNSRTGGFSVSLACPDGSVIGGGLAGPLIAASAIQAVVGTFKQPCEARRVPEAAAVPPNLQHHVGVDTSFHGVATYSAGGRAEEPAEPLPDINMPAPIE